MCKTVRAKLGKIACWIAAIFLVIALILYISTSLAIYDEIVTPGTFKSDIVKKAVALKDLEGKQYIICDWVQVTGANYYIIQDENGNQPEDPYCVVTGACPEKELSYDFMVFNKFVIYYSEKKPVDFDGIDTIEYIATGWDVLYRIKHGNPFIYAPNHVLKYDYK